MVRILIIEDEPDLAGLIDYNLRAAGFQTDVAGTGAGGLALARSGRPDLVLLDLMLPDLSGGEVLRLLKADPELRASASPPAPVPAVSVWKPAARRL